MKVDINSKEGKDEKPFPKLMVSNEGRVVLMLGIHITGGNGVFLGRVDKRNDVYDIGHISDNWSLPYFKDFHGSVTLYEE